MIDPHAPHDVAVVVMPGLGALDFGIALYSFGFAPYRLTVCGEAAVNEVLGHSLVTPQAGLDAVDGADTVVVPGYFSTTTRPSDALIAALRSAHDRGARVVSNSTAAFALGYAGLLDGHQATTHWMHLDSLAAEFPRADVRSDVLYVTDRQLSTSAGAASSIDLFLDMVRTDLGAAAANERRRRLVAAPPRSGSERQFFESLVPHPCGDSVVAVRAWSLDHLHEPLSLTDMAAHANMSVRNFSRRFIAETGNSPMKWLQGARIDYARELLESTDKTIADIARRVGLGSRANFRRIFTQHVGIGPGDYRGLHRDHQGSDDRPGEPAVTVVA